MTPTTMFVLHAPKKGPTWRGWEKCSGAVPGDLHRERMDLMDASTALLNLLNNAATFCEPCANRVRNMEARTSTECHEGTCPTSAGSHAMQLDRAKTALAEANRALSDAQMTHHYHQSGGAGTLVYTTRPEAEKALKVVDPDGSLYFVIWPIVVQVPDAGDSLTDATLDTEFNPAFASWLERVNQYRDSGNEFTPQQWHNRCGVDGLALVAKREFGDVDRLGFSVGIERHWYWPNGEMAACLTRGHDDLSWDVTVQRDNGVVVQSNNCRKYAEALMDVTNLLGDMDFGEGTRVDGKAKSADVVRSTVVEGY